MNLIVFILPDDHHMQGCMRPPDEELQLRVTPILYCKRFGVPEDILWNYNTHNRVSRLRFTK